MKSTVKLAIVSVLCLVLFGTCAFFMRNLLFGDIVGTYEQAAPNKSEYQDKWVSYEVIACLGCYAEGTESYAFIPTGHEYYYLIWMADGSIMPLSVSKKADREYLDAMTDATYDYIDGITDEIMMEPRTFIGTLDSQETEVRKYYLDTLREIGVTEADGWVLRYELLDCTKTRTSYILLVGAVMMIPVLGITMTIVTSRKEKKKAQTEQESFLPR